MVSKASSIKGSAQAINYIMKEEKQSYELCRNDLIGSNGKEILSEFRETQGLNSNCKNNTISIVLSPNNDQIHSKEALKKFTKSHLKNLGLSHNQYIACVHKNTKATHVHIIANRINHQGKALNDSYIGFKAQNSAEKIALENGLKTAKEVRRDLHREKNVSKGLNKSLKEEIYKAHNLSVKQSKTFPRYMKKMDEKGYRVVPSINKGGKLQGFRIEDKTTDLSFKASEIHRNCGIKSMLGKGVSFSNLKSSKVVSKGLMKGTERIVQPLDLISNLTPALKTFQVGMKLTKTLSKGIQHER